MVVEVSRTFLLVRDFLPSDGSEKHISSFLCYEKLKYHKLIFYHETKLLSNEPHYDFFP